MGQEIKIGIDEAGRGALVGPVYAACCLIKDDFDVSILDDSKKLSELERTKARNKIIKSCIYGIGFATHKEIDELNILKATFLAMQRAFENFLKSAFSAETDIKGAKIIVDGNRMPDFLKPFYEKDNSLFYTKKDNPDDFFAQTMVKADSKEYSVMAASILAKTSRDNFMYFCDRKWPEYDFKSHKGYGTKKHFELIKKYGKSPIARETFSFAASS